MQKIYADAPKVNESPRPVLLYAGDAILISRTGNGLQLLIDGFTTYMEDKDMKINLKKTFTMTCRKGRPKRKTHYLKGIALAASESFTYLGVNFSSSDQMGTDVEAAKLKCIRSSEALCSFASKIGNKPIRELLAIYKGNVYLVSITEPLCGA